MLRGTKGQISSYRSQKSGISQELKVMNIHNGNDVNDSSGTGGRLGDRGGRTRDSESENDDDEYHPSKVTDSESEGAQAYDSPDCVAFKLPQFGEQPSGRARVREMSGVPLTFRKEYQEGKQVTVVDWDDDDECESKAVGKVFTKAVFTPRRDQAEVSQQFGLYLGED
jgi:hypothetical protein